MTTSDQFRHLDDIGPLLYEEPKYYHRKRQRPYLLMGNLILVVGLAIFGLLIYASGPWQTGQINTLSFITLTVCASSALGTAGYFYLLAWYTPRFKIYKNGIALPLPPLQIRREPRHCHLFFSCIKAVIITKASSRKEVCKLKPGCGLPLVEFSSDDIGDEGVQILKKSNQQRRRRTQWVFNPKSSQYTSILPHQPLTGSSSSNTYQRRVSPKAALPEYFCKSEKGPAVCLKCAHAGRKPIRFGAHKDWSESGRYWSRYAGGTALLVIGGIFFWVIVAMDYFQYPPFTLLTVLIFAFIAVPSCYWIFIALSRSYEEAGGALKTYPNQWKLQKVAQDNLGVILHRVGDFLNHYGLEFRVNDHGSKINEHEVVFTIPTIQKTIRFRFNPSSAYVHVTIIPSSRFAERANLKFRPSFDDDDRGYDVDQLLEAGFDEMFELDRIYIGL